MTKEKKFYRTIYKVEVLSEYPLNSALDLDCLHRLITDGDCSGVVECESSTKLTGKEAAHALAEQGSDPSFFGLDEEGENS